MGFGNSIKLIAWILIFKNFEKIAKFSIPPSLVKERFSENVPLIAPVIASAALY